MATLLAGFLDAFLSRSQTIDAGLWNNNGGGSFAVGQGTHSADLEWSNYNPVARTFSAASVYMGAGIEGRQLLGPSSSGFSIFAPSVGATIAAVLKTNASGGMELWYGNLATQLAVTTSVNLANSNYYTLEFFYGAVAGVGNGRCEVRINGLRVPELTTTNFGASGGQPAGTLNPTTAGGGLNWANFGVPDRIVLCPFAVSNGIPVQYYWQKNGASLWQTLATGSTTYATDASDFVGVKKKAWVYPNAVGNYTMPGAGSGTQTSNWNNGAGTYPSNIADQPAGMDSDTSYIRNSTNGSGVAADKISHKYADLPATAVNIGWVQRTVWGRLFQASTGNIRSGVRSPATATPANTDSMDANAALGATYGVGTSFQLSNYYPRMPYTVAGSDIWTPATVGNSGSTTRAEGVIEMLSGLS